MSDPRTDFFASGGADSSPVASQDARTAFFATGGQSDSQAPATVYDAALFRKRVGRDPEPAELANFKASKGVGWAGDPTQGKFTIGQAVLGGAEDALSLATGVPASVAAAGGYLYGLTGRGGSDSLSAARSARNALTYQPRTEAGQAGMETIGQIKPGEIVPRLLDVAGHPQAADTVREVEERASDVAPLGAEALSGFKASRAIGQRFFAPIRDPEAEPRIPGMDSQQSMGAAAASPRLTQASPELQHAIVTSAQKTGGAINPHALARHLEADTLPVPVRLTEGEALGDVTKISNERNNAGLADFYNKRNGNLKDNLQAIRDDVGPDVYTSSYHQVGHGETLIKAYEDKAALADADISAKYKALRDANNGDFPADPKQLVTNTTAALKREMLTSKAPTDVMASLREAAERGNITLEEFETARTRLAQIARSSSDGQERAAAGVVRQEFEKLPLSGNAAKLKGLADAARGAAKAQFDALDADPAYKAAIEGKVAPDDFVRRFVINGKRDDVALMKENFADNPVAQQTMGVATVQHLRDAARVNPDGTGTFSQGGYNKALRALDPKMRSLVSPDHAETLEQLGNVARYTQEQPAGHFINNSKTFVAAAAEGAKGLAEHAVNSKTLGIGGTAMRNFAQKRAAKAALHRITAPGAGLDVLEEKP